MRISRAGCVALVTLATFIDIVAYAIAVPVLPDIGRRYGATPATIGFLFASFGVTLLLLSIPMGALSDRTGRKRPMIVGLIGLAAATVLFAFADRLAWLFVARMVQGAGDAVTWVVGLALIADLYDTRERGRMTGFVMSGASLSFMIGPSIGGWLYEIGGMRLPFLAVAAVAVAAIAAWSIVELPEAPRQIESGSVREVLRAPGMTGCIAAVIIAAATLSMLEPIGALRLDELGAGPARTGMVFGAAALSNAFLHPFFGRLSDRFGARTMTLVGLVVAGAMLPLYGLAWSYMSMLVLCVVQAGAMSLPITPSLSYMTELASSGRTENNGVGYGIYNVAWAVGLMVGPSIGGVAYERVGFARMMLMWSPAVVVMALLVARSSTRSLRVDTRRAVTGTVR
jgi:multidrug resistance protein